MNKTLGARIKEWSEPPFDKETIEVLEEMKKHPQELEDAFYKNLEFGTGGMRGIMGVGTNRINAYTLGKINRDRMYEKVRRENNIVTVRGGGGISVTASGF